MRRRRRSRNVFVTITGDGGIAGDFEERRVGRHQDVDVVATNATAAITATTTAAEVSAQRLQGDDLDGAVGVLFVRLLLVDLLLLIAALQILLPYLLDDHRSYHFAAVVFDDLRGKRGGKKEGK